MKDVFGDFHTIEDFFENFPSYREDHRDEICRAWDFLCEQSRSMVRENGENYTDHPLRTAAIIAANRMDWQSIIGALLHNALTFEGITAKTIEENFGKEVSVIVSGTSRIGSLKMQNKTLQQADSVRKMLFAMIDDIRVILVKLADRLDMLRNMKTETEEYQRQIAQETFDVWAPLANRLGMSSLKDELEDLALKYANPDAFAQIKQLVALKKDERSEYLNRAQQAILKAAAKANIEITLSSRAKHFYSIYQKMKKRGKAADEIYDLLALRILCNDTNECYALVGIVHSIWKPLDGRFKDYIAMPKANGYQSLHTTVICEGMPLEIQIRTNEMHSVAEHGVASHWLYKKGTNRDSVSVENLSIINQLKALRAENGNDAALFEEIRNELLGDSIFVFTPQGDVRELPMGATAVDFAYSIHSHIGETITGAKADGHIIPLSSPLKNTQIIEILTSPQAHPTENQLEYVKTARARSKIRAWLLQNGISEPVPQNSSGGSENGSGSAQVRPSHGSQQGGVSGGAANGQEGGSADGAVHIRVGDTANFMVHAARCCNPAFGDKIIGYVSRGRGLIIHRADCSSFSLIPNVDQRSVPVVWDEKPVAVPRSRSRKK